MDSTLEKRIKRHVIGKPHLFLAVTPLGFEQTLVNEFKFFNIEVATTHDEIEPYRIIGDGKVEFTAKITEAWKIVAYSRIANRVLMEVANFKAENFRELEKKAAEIPWELYLDERTGKALQTRDESIIPSNSELATRKSIHIHVTCKHSRLYHSDAIAERLYNVIAQSNLPQSEASSSGAPIPQNLYVDFLDDRCTIWLDLAGEELYKRGFERFVNDAPLKETIAAGMLFEAIHLMDPISTSCLQDNASDTPAPHFLPPTSFCLLDLMSGSGTFSLEAACIANKIIPGICRDFALKHQPAFKEATWKFLTRRETKDERRETKDDNHLKRESHPTELGMPACKQSVATLASHVIASTKCEAIHHPIIEKILTSDISERAVSIIKHNIECSPLANVSPTPILPRHYDFFNYTANEIADACGEASPILVLNPPYGKRLHFDAPKLYTNIGKKIAELAHDLKSLNKRLTVVILVPKDDNRDGSKYTCTANFLHECPAMSPKKNPAAKQIITSHGGFSLNVFIAVLDS